MSLELTLLVAVKIRCKKEVAKASDAVQSLVESEKRAVTLARKYSRFPHWAKIWANFELSKLGRFIAEEK